MQYCHLIQCINIHGIGFYHWSGVLLEIQGIGFHYDLIWAIILYHRRVQSIITACSKEITLEYSVSENGRGRIAAIIIRTVEPRMYHYVKIRSGAASTAPLINLLSIPLARLIVYVEIRRQLIRNNNKCNYIWTKFNITIFYSIPYIQYINIHSILFKAYE